MGQNFLLNKEIIKKIVDLGKITNESTIIEIGPGTGNLTQELIKKKPKKFIAAIEKDKALYEKLKNKYQTELDLINKDVLKIQWDQFLNQNVTIFGNLPYNISASAYSMDKFK